MPQKSDSRINFILRKLPRSSPFRWTIKSKGHGAKKLKIHGNALRSHSFEQIIRGIKAQAFTNHPQTTTSHKEPCECVLSILCTDKRASVCRRGVRWCCVKTKGQSRRTAQKLSSLSIIGRINTISATLNHCPNGIPVEKHPKKQDRETEQRESDDAQRFSNLYVTARKRKWRTDMKMQHPINYEFYQ